MRLRRVPHVLALLVLTCFWALPQSVQAVPSFAKGTGMTCSGCHTLWPQLNEAGREFKQTGYNTLDLEEVDTNLSLGESSPFSGRINLRLVDKRTSKLKTGDLTDSDKALKGRALHEIEVFLAGRAGDRLSYFAEIEAEDEWPDPAGDAPGFQAQVAMGAVQVVLNEYANAFFGYASPFYADAYNTLNYNKANRRGRAWQKTDSFLPGSSQVVGMAVHRGQFSGLAAWHGNPGELEGKDARDFSGRLAVDVVPGVMIGGWGDLSQSPPFANEYDKTMRAGADAQVDIDIFSVNALFALIDRDPAEVAAKVAADDGTQDTNISVEGHLLLEVADNPIVSTVVPTVAIDRYTVSDGDEDFLNLGAFLTLVHKDNWRSQVGWEGNLTVPDAYDHKESRLTAVVDFGF